MQWISSNDVIDSQPWILKVGGKNGKKFRGNREGGVSEHASFYVFAHAPDGAIEAYPLHEWYWTWFIFPIVFLSW